MANLFVRSTDGNDSDNGSTWALAKATLASALSAAAAGDTIFVADAHAETAGSGVTITLTSPGTAASPCRILCVDDTGDPSSPTTLATTAVVETTNTNIVFNGFAYVYGITFKAGNASVAAAQLRFISASPSFFELESCLLRIHDTHPSGGINVGNGSVSYSGLRLINTNIQFAEANQAFFLNMNKTFEWVGGSLVLGTAPTAGLLLLGNGTAFGRVLIRGVDLANLGSGPLAAVSGDFASVVRFEWCKLGSGFTLTTGTLDGPQSVELVVDNCDSGDTNYKMARRSYMGNVDAEATIVRTGGASDGTTPLSWKLTSNSNTKYHRELVSPDIFIWNETVGSSVTLTAEIVTDNVTLTDAEAWLEIEYLGTSGNPKASFASDRKANTLATAANQTTSSVTWTTTGLSTPTKQKLAVSVTPQEKGLIRARVVLAKASTTMYVCPKLDVT